MAARAPAETSPRDPLFPILAIVVVLSALIYVAGLTEAAIGYTRGAASKWPSKEALEKLLPFMTAIGAVLATSFGAIFGLNSGLHVSSVKRHGLLPHRWAFAPGSDPSTLPSRLQVAAAYVYFGSLIVALLIHFFGVKSPNAHQMAVDTIDAMTKTAIGVFVGLLAIALKVSPKS